MTDSTRPRRTLGIKRSSDGAPATQDAARPARPVRVSDLNRKRVRDAAQARPKPSSSDRRQGDARAPAEREDETFRNRNSGQTRPSNSGMRAGDRRPGDRDRTTVERENRGDRPQRFDRSRDGAWGDRGDRPERGYRADRSEWSARDQRGQRNERYGPPDAGARRERPSMRDSVTGQDHRSRGNAEARGGFKEGSFRSGPQPERSSQIDRTDSRANAPYQPRRHDEGSRFDRRGERGTPVRSWQDRGPRTESNFERSGNRTNAPYQARGQDDRSRSDHRAVRGAPERPWQDRGPRSESNFERSGDRTNAPYQARGQDDRSRSDHRAVRGAPERPWQDRGSRSESTFDRSGSRSNAPDQPRRQEDRSRSEHRTERGAPARPWQDRGARTDSTERTWGRSSNAAHTQQTRPAFERDRRPNDGASRRAYGDERRSDARSHDTSQRTSYPPRQQERWQDAGEARPRPRQSDGQRSANVRSKPFTDRAPIARPSRERDVPDEGSSSHTGIRLSKRMSELGLCSRREADEWIPRGWVRVDGVPVTELGTRISLEARIEIDAAARSVQEERVTILLHKPVGYVSGQAEDGYTPAVALIDAETQWSEDTSGKRFQPWHRRSLAPAGRLDIDSTGLLVLTQDGRIAKTLIGEDSTIEKEYLVRVAYATPEGVIDRDVQQAFPPASLRQLEHGLSLDGVPLKPAKVSWQNPEQLRFVLREGKKRQIRRMCELVGLQVVGLKRIRMGRVTLGTLPPGQWRYLGKFEKF
jgi:23S rRNA pseudouridine2604 synthase